jgi:hypothetical protein
MTVGSSISRAGQVDYVAQGSIGMANSIHARPLRVGDHPIAAKGYLRIDARTTSICLCHRHKSGQHGAGGNE